jgi:hypothetical protein
MRDFTLGIKISVDDNGAPQKIGLVTDSVDKLGDSAKKASGHVNTVAASIDKTGASASNAAGQLGSVGTALSGVTAAAIAATAATAFIFERAMKAAYEYNQMLENTRLGFATMAAATLEFRDATGKLADSQETFADAMVMSAKLQEQIRIASLQTAATFEQLSLAVTNAWAPAIRAGFNTDQIVKFSTTFIQAMTAMGIPAWQVSEEIRDTLGGTMADMRTRMKPLLDAVGLTNDKIKELIKTGQLYKGMMEGLSAVTGAVSESEKTLSVSISNLLDGVNTLLGTGLQPFFVALSGSARDLTGTLFTVKDGTIQWNEALLTTLNTAGEAMARLLQDIKRAAQAIDDFMGRHQVLMQAFRDLGQLVNYVVGVWISKTIEGWGYLLDAAASSVEGLLNDCKALGEEFRLIWDWLAGLIGKVPLLSAAFQRLGNILSHLWDADKSSSDEQQKADITHKNLDRIASDINNLAQNAEKFKAIQKGLNDDLQKGALSQAQYDEQVKQSMTLLNGTDQLKFYKQKLDDYYKDGAISYQTYNAELKKMDEIRDAQFSAHVKQISTVDKKALEEQRREAEKIAKDQQRLEDELAKKDVSLIQDETQRKIAEANLYYDNLQGLAHGNAAKLAEIETVRARTIAKIQDDAHKKEIEEAEKTQKKVNDIIAGYRNQELEAYAKSNQSKEELENVWYEKELKKHEDDKVSVKQYLDEIEALNQAHQARLGRIRSDAEAEQKAEAQKRLDDYVKSFDHAYEQMANTLSDWIDKGRISFSSMTSMFKKMVADMLANWLLLQARMSLPVSVGGFIMADGTLSTAGQAAATGSYSGDWSIVSTLASGFSLLSNGIQGVYNSLNGGVIEGLADISYQLGSDQLGESLMKLSMSAYAGPLTAGIGSFLLSMFTSQDWVKSIASGIGSAAGFTIGNYIYPGIGGVVGAAVGSLAGLFFHHKIEPVPTIGIEYNPDDTAMLPSGEIDARRGREILDTADGWIQTFWKDVGDFSKAGDEINKTFDQVRTTAMNTLKAMGMDISGFFEKWTWTPQGDAKGKTAEELQAMLEDAMAQYVQFASKIDFSKAKKDGETLLQTIDRVFTSMETLSAGIPDFGAKFKEALDAGMNINDIIQEYTTKLQSVQKIVSDSIGDSLTQGVKNADFATFRDTFSRNLSEQLKQAILQIFTQQFLNEITKAVFGNVASFADLTQQYMSGQITLEQFKASLTDLFSALSTAMDAASPAFQALIDGINAVSDASDQAAAKMSTAMSSLQALMDSMSTQMNGQTDEQYLVKKYPILADVIHSYDAWLNFGNEMKAGIAQYGDADAWSKAVMGETFAEVMADYQKWAGVIAANKTASGGTTAATPADEEAYLVKKFPVLGSIIDSFGDWQRVGAEIQAYVTQYGDQDKGAAAYAGESYQALMNDYKVWADVISNYTQTQIKSLQDQDTVIKQGISARQQEISTLDQTASAWQNVSKGLASLAQQILSLDTYQPDKSQAYIWQTVMGEWGQAQAETDPAKQAGLVQAMQGGLGDYLTAIRRSSGTWEDYTQNLIPMMELMNKEQGMADTGYNSAEAQLAVDKDQLAELQRQSDALNAQIGILNQQLTILKDIGAGYAPGSGSGSSGSSGGSGGSGGGGTTPPAPDPTLKDMLTALQSIDAAVNAANGAWVILGQVWDRDIKPYTKGIYDGINNSNGAWVLLGQVWTRDIAPYTPYLKGIYDGINASNGAWVILGQVWTRDIAPYTPYLKNISSGGGTFPTSTFTSMLTALNAANGAWVLLGQVWDRDIKPYTPYLKNISSGGGTFPTSTFTSMLTALNAANNAWVLLGQVWDRDIAPYMPLLSNINNGIYNSNNAWLMLGQLWNASIPRMVNNLWDIDRRHGGPGYAEGGISTGPLSGHLEMLHGTEAVIPLKTGGIPVQIINDDGKLDLSSLKDEIRGLRDDMVNLQYQIAKNSIKTGRIIEKWDYDGMPAVRQ